jgi:hypothetical protein
MPTECPKHSVIALVAIKRMSALHEKQIGPRTMLIAVIVTSQSDFAGAHCTFPSSGSVLSSAKIRSEPGSSFISSLRPAVMADCRDPILIPR